jgi:radical SAM superfamily enzyme YgiQ (UPF0313 family)
MHTVREALTDLDPPPDLVVITTLMTYWYPGARAASELVRTIWPDTPVVLGGVYATACPEHAESLDSFDLILSGPLEAEDNWRSLWRLLKSEPPALPEDAGLTFFRQGYPSPQYSFLLASRGCPLSCTYCASGILYPGLARRDPKNVIDEAARDWQRGARDFAFFDDALLLAPQLWLEELLACLPARLPGVRLHAPNALHVRALDSRTCQLLKAAGLSTIRLGLETANFASRPDSKLSREEWDAGLRNLFAAGFNRRQIGAYILFGLPGQDFNDVHQAAAFAWSYGIQPHVAEYSPIPGSGLFSEAERCSDYPLSEEPLFQNSSVWPCVPGGFSWSARQHLRSLLSSARPKGG